MGCHPNDSFEFNKVWWWMAIITSTLFTLYLCYNFITNALSRLTPSKLMLARTISDYIQLLIFFISVSPYNYSSGSISSCSSPITCHILGALFIATLVGSAVYYASICVDLYLTLKNPFRKPASNSLLIHGIVWISSIVLVIPVGAARQLEYRNDFQFCWTKYIPGINYWNVMIIYIPAVGIIVGGLFVSYWSFKRLQIRILDNTFELRWNVIKRQFGIVGCFTLNYIIQMCIWIVLFGTDHLETPTKTPPQPYLFSIFVFCAIFFDFTAWFIKDKIGTCWKGTGLSTSSSSQLKQMGDQDEQDVDSDLLNNKIIDIQPSTEIYQLKKGGKSNRLVGNKYRKMKSNLSSAARPLTARSIAVDKHYKEKHSMDKIEPTLGKNQNLSNALRREVITFINGGLFIHIKVTAWETKQFNDKLSNHGNNNSLSYDDYNDISFNNNNNNNNDVHPAQVITQNKTQLIRNNTAPTNNNNNEYDYYDDNNSSFNNIIKQQLKKRFRSNKHVKTNTFSAGYSSYGTYNDNNNNNNKGNSIGNNNNNNDGGLSSKRRRLGSSHIAIQQKLGKHSQLAMAIPISVPMINNNNNISEEKEEDYGNKQPQGYIHNDMTATRTIATHKRSTMASDISSSSSGSSSYNHDKDNNNNIRLRIRSGNSSLSATSTERTTNSDYYDEDDDDYDTLNDNNLIALNTNDNNDDDIQSNSTTPTNTDPNYDTNADTLNAEECGILEFDVGGTPDNNRNGDDTVDIYSADLNTIEAVPLNWMYPSSINTSPTNRGIINRFNIGIAGSDGDKVLFTDYAPHVFRYLRTNIYNVSDIEYLRSIVPNSVGGDVKKISEDIIAKFSEGRSGAFFFFTQNNKYLIKTLNKSEADLLLNTLKSYVNYMKKHKNATYLTKYYGLHSIKLYSKIIYFVVNGNVFPSSTVKYSRILEKYDIKGSWIDRNTHYHIIQRKLMKDEDLHKKLQLSPIVSSTIHKQLENDTEWLKSQNIMDYSLLLGVSYEKIINNKNKETFNYSFNTCDDDDDDINENKEHDNYGKHLNKTSYEIKANIVEGPGTYYIGIIDMLQSWNTNKKLERFLKVYFRCKEKHGISCVEPEFYRKRFLRKMTRIGI